MFSDNKNANFDLLGEKKPKVETKVSKSDEIVMGNEFIKNIFEELISSQVDEFDPDIFEISKDEVDEMLEKVDGVMEEITTNVLNIAQNNELKRYLHTLKGSVRMAGCNRIGSVAHRLESLLDYTETRKISLFSVKPLLDEEIDKIRYMLSSPEGNYTKEKLDWIDRKIVDKTSNQEHNDVIEIKEELSAEKIEVKTTPIVKKEEKQSIKIDANLIDNLINEAGEVRLTRTTLEGMADNESKSLFELKDSTYKLERMLKEIEVEAESQIQAGKDKFSEDSSFDPLEFDRYTRLQELTRFMTEVVADINDTVENLDVYNKIKNTTISQQSVLTNNILDSLMKVRLLPIGSIADRLYKITRNTAKELNKRVNLVLEGEKTEMDRLVLEKIVSPLEHLLRNSIAHGVEEPSKRAESGKSQTGLIKISTTLDGNFIIIKIQDDGAGINLEKVKSIGLKKGMLTSSKTYSKEEIVDLIFQSGFSTADAVSQVAGRGVGMDVVKNDISALGGSVKTDTEPGQGTTFTITIPVALATNQAMLTENMGKLVAIPAIIVNEVISVKKSNLERFYKYGKLEYKGRYYKVVYMGHLIGELNEKQLPEMKTFNKIILINYLNEELAVHVDELQTTTEILIKKVGSHLSKINGLLGVTLLGDGRQGIVINPVMLKNHFDKFIKSKDIIINNDNGEIVEDTSTITVMVVDDSITVRRATSKVLEKNHFNVILAKDGEDALEQLQIVRPHIILSDIEMPRMDGFEFAKNVKNSDKYKDIPIIMITSRTADKHKNYAYSLGVNDFLGKPYQEEELVSKINSLLKK
jgi:chemosensory pili system protein ChpA (sensor histidine kinase/response regulator)